MTKCAVLDCLVYMDSLDFISTQTNVQRVIRRQLEIWCHGDWQGNRNIAERRYIDLVYIRKYNKEILCRTAWSFFVGREAEWRDNTYIYLRRKFEILPLYDIQVLSFAGGDWCLISNAWEEIVNYTNQRWLYIFSNVFNSSTKYRKQKEDIVKLNGVQRTICLSLKLNLTCWLGFRHKKPQRDTRANETWSEKSQWKVKLLVAIKPRSVDVKIIDGIEIPSLDKKKVLHPCNLSSEPQLIHLMIAKR